MTDISLEGWGIDLPSQVAGGRIFGDAFRHVIGTALATAMLGAAATLVALALGRPPEPAHLRAAAPVAWREIARPVRIYDLESPLFAAASVTYSARQHGTDGGREDALGLGRFNGSTPVLRLRMFRRAGEAPTSLPLYAAVAHETAQAGLGIARSGLAGLLPTRFGAFDVLDVDLIGSGGVSPVPCQAFRLVVDEPALSITGFACGTRNAPLSRPAVGCLIERLDVAAARDDRALIDFFAASELRRNATCAGSQLAPDTLHAAWLDEPAGAEDGDKVATSRRSLRRR